ncbi:hypothetical protein ACHAPE_002749 [Trichoderma viride]
MSGTTTNPRPLAEVNEDIGKVFYQVPSNANKLTKAIYKELVSQYLAERNTWPAEDQCLFKVQARLVDYSITPATGKFSGHNIQKYMAKSSTWTYFFFLRVMFNPKACANQTWFPDFVKKHPMAGNQARGGVVPKDFLPIINDNTPGEYTPAPQDMEIPVINEFKIEKRKAQVELQRERKKAMAATQNPDTSSSPQATAPETPEHKHSLQNNMEGVAIGMTNTQTPTTQATVAENILSWGTAAPPPQTPRNWVTVFGAQSQQPSIFNTGTANVGELQTKITALRTRIKVLEEKAVDFKSITKNQTQAIRHHREQITNLQKRHDAAITALEEEVAALKVALTQTMHRLAATENRQAQYDATMRQLGQTLVALADSGTEPNEDVGI